jgi:AcrR family transcriptional regulator
MVVAVDAPVRRRMRAGDRRAQLLDEAARLVTTSGIGSVTIERLAEQAGVSKALPYRHFADADAVLVALYRRETTALGAGVVRALSAAPAGADLVRVGVHAYVDGLLPRREVLAALTSPGRAIPALADPDHTATRFAASILRQFHGLDQARSRAVAGMVEGAMAGAAGTLLAGVAPRQIVEDALVAMIHAALPAP